MDKNLVYYSPGVSMTLELVARPDSFPIKSIIFSVSSQFLEVTDLLLLWKIFDFAFCLLSIEISPFLKVAYDLLLKPLSSNGLGDVYD